MGFLFQFTLDCNESSFHQLEVFKIEKVDVLQWTMEKGAMPSLQRLVIERCDFDIMPLKNWQRCFKSCGRGMDVSSMSIHLIEKKMLNLPCYALVGAEA